MVRIISGAALGMLIAGSAWAQGAVTPAGCKTSTVATGGTAVTVLSGSSGIHGGYILNAADSTNEGVTTEPLFIDPTTTATTTGNGTNVPIAAGGTWFFIPNSGKDVSVNATTSGHKFTCVIW